MTVTNHALIGAAIGLTIKEPLLALPLALVSHLIFDTLPHFGFKDWHQRQQHKRLFKVSTIVDVLLLVLILGVCFASSSWLVGACAFLAMSPDLGWAYRFTFRENFGKNPPPPENFAERFHKSIQRYEFPKGVYLEIGFAAMLTYLILTLS